LLIPGQVELGAHDPHVVRAGDEAVARVVVVRDAHVQLARHQPRERRVATDDVDAEFRTIFGQDGAAVGQGDRDLAALRFDDAVARAAASKLVAQLRVGARAEREHRGRCERGSGSDRDEQSRAGTRARRVRG